MSTDQLSLSKSNLAFAKLTATPNEKAWSQAYNAGNLFACLSLKSEEEQDLHALQTLGKDLFNNLEAEFFTLEIKNLSTITDAIQKSTKHIPEAVSVDFCLAYFKDTALYVFILGKGRVIMRRGEKLGVILEGKEGERSLNTASGRLQNNDTIILETNQFANNISDKHLSESLQLSLPSDIAEALSVHMHEKTDGDQAAIIVTYHGISKPAFEKSEEDEDITLADAQSEVETVSGPNRSYHLPALHLPKFIHLPEFPRPNLNLDHRKKFFLSISLIILVLLAVSVFLTKQKQENSQKTELFNSIYPPALKSYDEGKGLENLNASLSMEDFQKAEKLLTDGKDKFPQGSKEDQQIEELLAKVQSELGSGLQTNVKEVTLSENNILIVQKSNSGASGFSQNNDNIYFITDNSIFAINKKSDKKTEIIKNDNDWKKAIAIAPFQSNLYVLDTTDGILKFTPSGSNFNKSSYLKESVNLNKAVSMAIDSSIWVLFSDGSIKKYLRGTEESFSVKNLDKPFSNPTKIFTTADTDNLYILDDGNSRIVKLGKDGAFQKSYSAGIIKSAKGFEVLEKDKKANILSGDKAYEIALD